MSSKALALLVQGLVLLGDGLKEMAKDLEEGAGDAVLGKVATAPKDSKTEEKKLETKKETVKETKTEAAPEVDFEAIRATCTALVKEKVVLPGKKAEILAALKDVGAEKVSNCPADKLVSLHAKLLLIK